MAHDQARDFPPQPDEVDRVDPPAGAVLLAGDGLVEVVGESYNRDAIAAVTGGRHADGVTLRVWAVLDARDDNPHDPNAIAVLVHGRHTGYLSREDARRFRPILEAIRRSDRTACCRADVSGGWDRSPEDRGEFRITLHLAAAQYQSDLLGDAIPSLAAPAAEPPSPPVPQVGPGMVAGRPYFEWLGEARRMIDSGDHRGAEALLLSIASAAELASAFEGMPLAAEPFALLARLYGALGDTAAERAVLERFAAGRHDRDPEAQGLLARRAANEA